MEKKITLKRRPKSEALLLFKIKLERSSGLN